MANSSSAYGTVTLIGDWTPAMYHNLNALQATWKSWPYSIDIEGEFAPELRSLSFCGIGRWSFHAHLEALHDSCCEVFEKKPLLAITYMELTGAMERDGGCIEFVYADEEAGSHWISTDAVTLAAKDGRFFIKQSVEKGHEYTWENYLAQDFGGEEQLAELVDNLLKLLTADITKHDAIYGRVEVWAKANSLPHATASRMGEEKTAKFRAAFSDVITDPA